MDDMPIDEEGNPVASLEQQLFFFGVTRETIGELSVELFANILEPTGTEDNEDLPTKRYLE